MSDPTPPRSADDYLREAVGGLIAQLLVQTAILRAEVDSLRTERARDKAGGTAAVPAP